MADQILAKLDALAKSVEDAKGGIADLQESHDRISDRLDRIEGKVDAGFDALAREIREEHKILVDLQRSSSAHAEQMAEVLEALRLRRAAN